ncbi:MAG: PAS domain S-box protein [Anaerolineae bacterium]
MNTVGWIIGAVFGSLLFAGVIWLVIRHAKIRMQRLAETNARVQEREEQFHTLFTYAADAITVSDLETGRFLEVNEEGLRRWGYSLEELRGMTPADLVSPEYVGEVSGRMQELSEQGRIFFETVHRCKDGALIATEISAQLIHRAGRTVVLAISRDITERKRAEAAAHEVEERFRLAFHTSPDAININRLADGTFVDINEGFITLTGYTREDVIGKTSLDIEIWCDPADRQKLVEGLQDQGHYENLEARFRHKNGDIGIGLMSAKVIMLQGVPHILSITRDITGRKRAEAVAHELEERFRVAFHTSPDAINIIRLEDGLYVDINEGFTALTGYTREDVIGKHSSDIEVWCDPADRLKLVEGLADKGYYDNLEARFRNKNGEIGICLMSAKVIVLQGVLHILSITRDITERKHAEDALQKSEERLRLALSEMERLLAQIQAQARQVQQIIDAVPEGVLLLNASGQILLTNPVAENILSSLAVDLNEQLTHLGNRTLAELLTSPPKGLRHKVMVDERLFEIIARSIADGLEPEHWVLVIHDATQERSVRQQLERQERLASVGQLAAGIAHDFNNILASIVLYSQMSLRAPDLPPKLNERLSVIVEQARRAADLVNQILDFGRRAVLDRQPVDLAALLQEQTKLWERTLPETIRIVSKYGTDAYTVNADQTWMQQMLMNLVLNARDAMPDGGVLRIELTRVSLTDVEPSGDWVRVDVTDTGMGIPEEVLPRIYDPFFTTKEPGEGSGLGLAQVYGIVVSHDGWIDVKSQVGVGTTFSIYLPALGVPEVAASPSLPEALPMGHGETILVVEDNPITRVAIVSALEMLQYHALEAANGKDALEIFAQHSTEIALVLSDLVMPEMGGKALVAALQERAPHMHMVVMSGHPLGMEMDGLRDSGVVACVQKPPGLQELAEALAEALPGDAEP